MAGWIVAFLFLLAGAGALVFRDGYPALGLAPPDVSYVILGFCIAIVTFWILSVGRNHGVSRALRDLGSWVLLTTAVAAGVTYRDDLVSFGHSIAAEIVQPGLLTRADAQSDGERFVRIRRRPDGHFIARTELNGFALPMLVDTGASTVVLRPADAQKLGDRKSTRLNSSHSRRSRMPSSA